MPIKLYISLCVCMYVCVCICTCTYASMYPYRKNKVGTALFRLHCYLQHCGNHDVTFWLTCFWHSTNLVTRLLQSCDKVMKSTKVNSLLFTTLWQPRHNLVINLFLTLYQPYHKVVTRLWLILYQPCHKVVTRLWQGYEKCKSKLLIWNGWDLVGSDRWWLQAFNTICIHI